MKEKGGSWVLRSLAVLSAVGLAAGYVVWKGTEAKGVETDSVGNAGLENEEEERKKLIVGSKSPGGDLIVFPQQASMFPNDDNQVRLLPGSKSDIVVMEIPDSGDESNQPLRVLSGSKSINFILDNPELDKAEGWEALQMLPGSKSLTPIFRQQETEQRKP